MNFFGTDGIRGEAQEKFNAEDVMIIATSAAKSFQTEGIKNVCLGKDPRISSEYILKIIEGTLLSYGINVIDLGTVSTPVISFSIINENDIDAGIMISASHNPYYDNGIKFFGNDGKKISHNLEEDIEKNILSYSKTKINIQNIGKLIDGQYCKENYINFLTSLGTDLTGIKILLDTSNGSAFEIAPTIFKKLNATIDIIANKPNGYNINENVGSTHLDTLINHVKDGDYDYAFAYDGDADRIMLIDSDAKVLDGDYIIYLLAKNAKEKHELKNNTIVSTVMTNLGFKKAIENLGINNIETSVGDKYVMRAMEESDIVIGGEQSGHIIISNFLPTGDGILTSVILSKIIKENPGILSQVKKELIQYPQVLKNYKCKDKNLIMNSEELKELINSIENNLNGEGRILVRASGTEELVRVMVEHKSIEKCDEIINLIIEKIKKI